MLHVILYIRLYISYNELDYVTWSTFLIIIHNLKDNNCIKCDYMTGGTHDHPLAVHPMRILLGLGKLRFHTECANMLFLFKNSKYVMLKNANPVHKNLP